MWNKNEHKGKVDRTNSHVGRWVLLVAVIALGGTALAQSGQYGGSRITVYADINFSGQSASFGDNTPNMMAAGWNDNISSMRIPDGETWEVCQDVNYGNQCQTLSGNVPDLRSIGWNDRISSMRRTNTGVFRNGGFGRRDNGNGSEGITLYVNTNFGGQSAMFRNDTPNLIPFNMNDKVSSIRIPNGEDWEVCLDVDYRNQCQVLSDSVADLRSMGWNDRISSIRQVDNGGFRDDMYRGRGRGRGRQSGGVFGNGGQQSLLFYAQPDYRGSSRLVSSGSSNMGFPAWQGSVRIRGGGTWELCDGSGECSTIDRDVPDVSWLGLNDRIMSARPMNNTDYRRDRQDDSNR